MRFVFPTTDESYVPKSALRYYVKGLLVTTTLIILGGAFGLIAGSIGYGMYPAGLIRGALFGSIFGAVLSLAGLVEIYIGLALPDEKLKGRIFRVLGYGTIWLIYFYAFSELPDVPRA